MGKAVSSRHSKWNSRGLPPPTTLMISTQREYNEAAVAAGIDEYRDEILLFLDSAAELLDSQGRPEWLEWAPDRLMPQTAHAVEEAGEQPDWQRVQREAEERAASYQQRRTAVEVSFDAGALTFEEFERELAVIYHEEDTARAEEEEGGPPTSEYEDDTKGDSDTQPDPNEKDESDENDASKGDAQIDHEPTDDKRDSNTTPDDTKRVNEEGDPEAGDNHDDVTAPPNPTIMVPAMRVQKRKDRGDQDVELREVQGRVSPYL